MAKRKTKHKRRVRNLALISTVATIVLVASTYAWFIGMRTVNVSGFDVTIAAVDGLSLSLDGTTWSETLNVGTATAYTGNTNTWAADGLKPVSSVGVVDTTSATLKLYEKASLTTTDGGYRLLASRVNNHTADEVTGDYLEQNGYVAFDLFIKNLSGSEYYEGAFNINNEEAIYLTNDSSVKVSTSGGVDGTGIENSVRVAFAQIGRVIATTTDADKITSLNCTTEEVPEGEDPKQYATGICRTATIWEPNDRSHVADAISYYTNSCKKRTGAAAYAGDCVALVDGLAKQTYAISDEINYKTEGGEAAPVVDIYDGADYNSYAGSTVLQAFNTFTDSEKLLAGTARPEFFTLAPNSITKVRVYVYIEGQDVDNYDFAQIGKKISVNFGFTKERFNEEDFDYDGPISNEGDGPFVWDPTANEGAGAYIQATDKTKPYITLSATDYEIINDTITVTAAENAFDASKVTATAFDKLSTFTANEVDGEMVYTVQTTIDTELEAADDDSYGVVTHTGTVNSEVPGTYQLVYSVRDEAGNLGTKVLNVVIEAAAGGGE